MKHSWSKIKDFFSFLTRYISPALFAVLVVAITTSILLFLPPINGLADNGDYYNVLNVNGLYIHNPKTYQYGDYFQNQYGIRQYFNDTGTTYLSTSQIFITLAIWLNKLFYSTTVFDLRFLGIVLLAFYLPAIYLITKGLVFKMPLKRQYVMAFIVTFILGDATYMIYFQSFYPEATAFIALLYIVGGLLYFTRVKKNFFMLFSLLLIGSFFFLGAYRYYYGLTAGTVVMLLGLLAYLKTKSQKLTLISVIVGIIVSVITITFITPDLTYERDVYHSMNRGVLYTVDNPGAILKEGGVNPQYGLLKNTSYYDEFSPVPIHSEELTEGLMGKTGYFWIILSYLNHPDQLNKLLNIAVQDIYLVKPNELSNYTQQDSKTPQEKTNIFMGYNRIKAAFFPKSFGFYLLFTAVMLVVYGIGFYNGLKKEQAWLCFRFFVVFGGLINMLLTFLFAVWYAGDADFARHLFLAAVFFDLLILLFIGDVLGKRLWSEEENE